MLTLTEPNTRDDLAEAMAHTLLEARAITRRGHEGKHKGCDVCGRYADLHLQINLLVTEWQMAPA